MTLLNSPFAHTEDSATLEYELTKQFNRGVYIFVNKGQLEKI